MTPTERFIEAIPEKPYCGGKSHGRVFQKVRSKDEATKYPLVQPNYPWLTRFICLDLDVYTRANQSPKSRIMDYMDTNAPLPNIVVANQDKGSCHYIYEIKIPVSRSNQKAMSLLHDVKAGLTTLLDADKAYNGLLTKNPTHRKWTTHEPYSEPHSLIDLINAVHDFVPSRYAATKTDESIGRNHTVFTQARLKAYSIATNLKQTTVENAINIVFEICQEINQTFTVPLDDKELLDIAKSITRWTRSKYQGSGEHKDVNRGIMNLSGIQLDTAQKQKMAAHRTLNIRRQKTITTIANAMKDYPDTTRQEIASVTKLSRQTVGKYWSMAIQEIENMDNQA